MTNTSEELSSLIPYKVPTYPIQTLTKLNSGKTTTDVCIFLCTVSALRSPDEFNASAIQPNKAIEKLIWF